MWHKVDQSKGGLKGPIIEMDLTRLTNQSLLHWNEHPEINKNILSVKFYGDTGSVASYQCFLSRLLAPDFQLQNWAWIQI